MSQDFDVVCLGGGVAARLFRGEGKLTDLRTVVVGREQALS